MRGVFRLMFFSPNLVGQVLVGILFSRPVHAALRPDHARLPRRCCAGGIEARWLTDPPLIMPAIVLASLWLWVGFNMIYFLAALQTVDKSLEEAARIDGANAWQVFWHVTLPSMRHVVVFVVIMSVIGSYQLFELPLTLLSRELRLRRQERRADADHLPQLLRPSAPAISASARPSAGWSRSSSSPSA